MSNQVAYRLGDGAPVGFDSARAIWAVVAREVLEENPGTASVAHSDLARQVQQRSGVYTRMPASEWLPAVLADIGDAPLTARLPGDAPPPAAPRGVTRRRPAAGPPRQEDGDASTARRAQTSQATGGPARHLPHLLHAT